MTGSDPQPDQCPVCGCEVLNHWETLDSWVCDNCSYAFENSDRQFESEVLTEISPVERSTEDSEEGEWEDKISIKDKSEENLVEVLSKTEEVVEELNLPDKIMVRAGEVVTGAWQSNFMHGRTKKDTVGAAIYAVSRELDHAVPPGILAQAVEADRQTIKKTYIQLKKDQQLELDPPAPSEFVGYIILNLDLSIDLKQDVKRFLREYESLGGSPIGIAAAATYKMANENAEGITLRDVATATTLTKETIWRHTQKF